MRTESPWLLAGVKSTSYAINMAAETEARRRGADDAVFLSREGVVLEGPVTNVWWRVGERLQTPALELGILAGVTRAEVLQVASRLGYGVEEGRYELERMASADEAFTSSSVREIMPVIELDGRPWAPAVQARRPRPSRRRSAPRHQVTAEPASRLTYVLPAGNTPVPWRLQSGAGMRPQSHPYPPDTNAPCVLSRLAFRHQVDDRISRWKH